MNATTTKKNFSGNPASSAVDVLKRFSHGRTRPTPAALERISISVPEPALQPYERALASVCESVGIFCNDTKGEWLIEGVKQVGRADNQLLGALALAQALSGITAPPVRERLAPEDWVARSYASFPEQCIGRRFAIRGSHIADPPTAGRIILRLDAGLAFGSGEHGSTRGCLRALEHVAHLCPRRILDLGTGSGILAIAAARLLRQPVRATDIDPWSVRLARQNAKANGVGRLVQVCRADGWRDPRLRKGAPYDLVLANILARPLMLMAGQLAAHLAPGGTVILSGLLMMQARAVLAAHRAHGLHLWLRIDEQTWTTLVMRARRA